jgi:hypothetical protein
VAGALGWYLFVRGGDPRAEVARAGITAPQPASLEPATPGTVEPARSPEPAKPAPAVKPEPVKLAAADPVPKAAPKIATDVKHRTNEPVRRVGTLASDLRAGKFDDVVGACQAARSVLARNLASCTLAACSAHDSANARAWFATVPARQKDALATRCAAAGTMVVAPKKVEPVTQSAPVTCDDPMACRK